MIRCIIKKCLCPIVVIFGALACNFVNGVLAVGQEECFFTWRELQSVIELEFSYFKFFHEYYESPTRNVLVTKEICISCYM